MLIQSPEIVTSLFLFLLLHTAFIVYFFL
uniref:Uncharacterized protein n=1 Tax=Arundo donax TaxID=35708 RepID=A0A0A8YGE5_ARUDO